MKPPHLIIMAAGKGKRMHSDLPKVVHPVLYRPMLHYVLDLALAIPHRTISVVVGHGAEQVKAACVEYPELRFVEQREQLGTGHAVQQVEKHLKGETGPVVVLSGDVILLRPETLTQLIKTQAEKAGTCALITAKLKNPTGLGRILRDASGGVIAIREQVDCSEEEKQIAEINCGIYCFEIPDLFTALKKVQNRNRQKEYYLTDVIGILKGEGHPLASVCVTDAQETLGINDKEELARVERVLQYRKNRDLLQNGVTMLPPDNVWIDVTSEVGPGVTIEGDCRIIGSKIQAGVKIESGCRIVRSEIGSQTYLKQGSYIEESRVGRDCTVGPYAHLRPGSVLESHVKLGNFVEVKKSTLKEGVKASHLSYIGDAVVGKDVNIGCGFITCNFDGGPQKHQTIIEDGVFVGSDSQTVAPVKLGKGSYVASGTTVTEDVPAGALAMSRGRQINKPNWKPKGSK